MLPNIQVRRTQLLLNPSYVMPPRFGLQHRVLLLLRLKESKGGLPSGSWVIQVRGVSYCQRLQALKLLHLRYDREIKDLMYFYKVLYGYFDVNINEFIIL